MHEYILFGQIADHEHTHVLQQLAGLTRMPPQHITEPHLVFRARPPNLLGAAPSIGGSQDIVPAEVQRTRALLKGSLFFVQLVGQAINGDSGEANLAKHIPTIAVETIVENTNKISTSRAYRWVLEFKDIPDAGKQPVSTRFVSRIPIQGHNITQFMTDFGFE